MRYFALGFFISLLLLYFERDKVEAWLAKEGIGARAGMAAGAGAGAGAAASGAGSSSACACSSSVSAPPSTSSIFPQQPSSIVRAPGGFQEITNDSNAEVTATAESPTFFNQLWS